MEEVGVRLEAEFLEHGRDGSQVGLCRGLVLELLGTLLLHIVRLGLDLALGLTGCTKRSFGGRRKGRETTNVQKVAFAGWLVAPLC